MTFITINNLNRMIVELTDYCNAACPMCQRFDWDIKLRSTVNKNHLLLPFFKDRIGTKVISQLDGLVAGGTYGDGAMNPDCLEIFNFIKYTNQHCEIVLQTNGGARNTDFWKELANLKVNVIFAIDGLQDTNHLYRRNVSWQKLMNNAEAFINAGGRAKWEYLIFKHNEHQIDQARLLSKKLGFEDFATKFTGRWKDFNDQGEYRDVDKIKVDNYYLEKPVNQGQPTLTSVYKDKEVSFEHKIVCKAFRPNFSEIYIRANGLVSPCCWLGDVKINEASRLVQDYSEINLNHSSLESILKTDFFVKLADGIYNHGSRDRLKTCIDCCGVN